MKERPIRAPSRATPRASRSGRSPSITSDRLSHVTDESADLEQWPPFIADVAAEALQFAALHPRASLSQARVAAEAICVHVHKREIGDPGKLMLDELVR